MSEHEPRPSFDNPETPAPENRYHVETATPTDLERLAAAIPPPKDDPGQYEFLLGLQSEGKGKLLVLRDGEDIVGCANLHYEWQSQHFPEIRGPHIDGIEVATERRGQRLVDRLLGAAEQEVRDRGGNELYLGVYSNNQGAIKAYERNGYQQIPGTAHTLSVEVDPDQIPEAYYKKSLI